MAPGGHGRQSGMTGLGVGIRGRVVSGDGDASTRSVALAAQPPDLLQHRARAWRPARDGKEVRGGAPIDAEAAILREAFRLHLQHGQLASVAKELTARALLPRSPRKCKPGRPLRWTVESIGRVLDNPLYADCTNTRNYGVERSRLPPRTFQS
jgi:hypothetical protein